MNKSQRTPLPAPPPLEEITGGAYCDDVVLF